MPRLPRTLRRLTLAVASLAAGAAEGQSTGMPSGPPATAYTFRVLNAAEGTGAETVVYGINDRGQVVGTSAGGGFLYEDDGRFTPLNVPGSGHSTTPLDINDAGLVVASAYAGACSTGYSYFAGVFTRVRVPAFGCELQPLGVNDRGQMVGTYSRGRSFVYDGGSTIRTIQVPGASPRRRSTSTTAATSSAGTTTSAATPSCTAAASSRRSTSPTR